MYLEYLGFLGFDEVQIANAVNYADLDIRKVFLMLTVGPDPFEADYIDPNHNYSQSSWANSALHDF